MWDKRIIFPHTTVRNVMTGWFVPVAEGDIHHSPAQNLGDRIPAKPLTTDECKRPHRRASGLGRNIPIWAQIAREWK